MRKVFSLILLPLFLMSGIVAQQPVSMATPPSFQFKKSLMQSSRVYKAVMAQDVEQLRREDMERAKDGHPLRMTVGVPVDIEFESASAGWLSLPGGERIWQRGIRSEGASGLIVSFEDLYIPEGGELFVYTADRTQVQRFDHTTNPGGGYYNTTRLMYDEVTLEYVQSTVSKEEPRIKVSGAGYIYRSNEEEEADMSCFIDINCEEGADWQIQKNGVVGLWMQFERDEWYVCSGSLVNNVRQDGTPYVLTAHHCIDGYTDITLPTMEFDFFKESTGSNNCHTVSQESRNTKTLTGCELVADIPLSGASDGTLLLLKQDIPSDWNVYYNGWDARGEAATSGVTIHHPNSLVKKVSTFTRALTSGQYFEKDDYGKITQGAKDAHWEVYWAETANGQSVTYGGSSGSPLFNENGLIVGTLTGGSSFCESPNLSDMYGKFSYHWDKYSNSKQHFKNYLDPDNTGTLVLEGYDPHAVPLTGAPEALPASGVEQNSFAANWNKMEGAAAYYLDVYAVATGEYVLRSKNVGDVDSYTVGGLQPGMRYNYAVRGGAGSSRSDYSNEIAVTTAVPSFDYYIPVALPATEVSATGFTANWEAIEGADDYFLHVYFLQGGENAGTATVDFAGQKLPDGWVSGKKDWYMSTGYYGQASPSFKFGADSVYIESPVFSGEIRSVSFWCRGANAAGSNTLTVSMRGKGQWEVVKTIQPSLYNNQGETFTITGSELPAGCTAMQFEYTKVSGNCALDDIVVEYGTPAVTADLAGYENRSVGNVLSHRVEVADALSGNYFYTVQATDGTLQSKVSNAAKVEDNTGIGLPAQEMQSAVFVDRENIVVRRENDAAVTVSLYGIAGTLLWSQSMSGYELALPKAILAQGVYFVKVGADTHKIVVN